MATTASATRRNEILTGVVIIGLFWGGLLAGELALRLFTTTKFWVRTKVKKSNRFYIEPETGLRRIKPNTQIGRIRINNMGFRGPDVAVAKQPGTMRIAFLGASTTFNAQARDGRTWPDLTARAIQRAVGETCQIEPVNAGQVGYSLRRVRTLYTHHVAPLRPDLVVFLPGDMNLNLDTIAREQALRVDVPKPSWLAEQSDEEKVRAAESALYFMPYIAIDDMIAVRRAYNAVTRRVAREEGAMLVAAEDAIPADLKHFVDTQHFTEAGSAVQACRVAGALLADSAFAAAAGRAGCRLS